MKEEQILNFNSIELRLASPEKIKEWSYGEVTRPETINYRTQRSERGGLFDERIFGPEKDYECYCGKYRRIRYKDVICEKCGVEVARSIVRRERMGHIELAAPVAHIWFLRGIPSRIGLLMGLSIAELEKVIYFAGYIITKINQEEKDRVLKELDREFKTKIKTVTTDEAKEKIKSSLLEVRKELNSLREGLVLDEPTHIKYTYKYGTIFESDIGAEAIYKMFQKIDLDELVARLEEKVKTTGLVDKVKLHKRLNLAKHMKRSGIRPEWMFLTVIPIIPPALRPMVALDGGRHATSDVNDLYRRVINRNNRLKKLVEISAPEVILRNEKRILQEAVDALIDNSIRHGAGSAGAMSSAQRRPLKSLADILKGKQGRFRQNLLGKRVDYSGRSVIVVGPELHFDQCGLPKHMALELFRPFVISKILERELAYNIRGAGRLIEDAVPEVWAILEDVIKNKYVLLNRAPTLHRLGIQAFMPILVEGNAIRLHPLVCAAFNADFDGDQMAVHVPLSDEAQKEARELMSSARNLLRPGTGDPIVTPKLDIVLGCYWMTKTVDGQLGEGKVFPTPNAAIAAYDYGQVGFRAKIKIMGGESQKYREFDGKIFETSVGKILFNSILPADFKYINYEMTGKEMPGLIEDLIEIYGTEAVPGILDKIKGFGFKYITMSGISWGIEDLNVPVEKPKIIKEARDLVFEIENNFQEGFVSVDERYKMIITTWRSAWDKIQKLVPETLDKNGGVHDMVASKARGSVGNLSQMCGMKGLIINTSGQTLEFPVIPSYKEGLSPIEYFITTHGSRKGLTDTALNTSKAGYLTRRLVDVSQDVVVSEEDCGEKGGRVILAKDIFEDTVGSAVRGRVLAKDLLDPKGNVLYKKGSLITKKDAKKVEEAGATESVVFSPLTCKSLRGVCQKCYGLDLGRNHLVDLGEAVGIVAAQAIGEPGTQLTMRTFHSGGVSEASGDITMGLPRIEEIFEKRAPKNAAVISEIDGQVMDIKNDGKEKSVTILAVGGKKGEEGTSLELAVPFNRNMLVRVGQEVKKGEILTDGSVNISELYKFGGKTAAEDYILNEVSKIYAMQAATISRKHIEVILRQMFSRKRIIDIGDTEFVEGEVVENQEFMRLNNETKGSKAKAEDMVLGISEVSLTTSSWLSSASFQNTSRILIDAATRGKIDHLRGLKENVIIGRLIPAGTGFKKKEESKLVVREEGDE